MEFCHYSLGIQADEFSKLTLESSNRLLSFLEPIGSSAPKFPSTSDISSAKALKTCIKYSTNDLSFVRIHALCDRATPEQYLLYKQNHPAMCTNLPKIKQLCFRFN